MITLSIKYKRADAVHSKSTELFIGVPTLYNNHQTIRNIIVITELFTLYKHTLRILFVIIVVFAYLLCVCDKIASNRGANNYFLARFSFMWEDADYT